MTLLEQLLITIVTAFATAILAYFGFWRQAKAELQKEYETRFNERKWNTYMELAKYIRSAFLVHAIIYTDLHENIPMSKRDMEIDDEFQQQLEKDIARIQNEIMLVGSKDVLNKFEEWVFKVFAPIEADRYTDLDNYKVTLVDLLNAMRKDLGKSGDDIDLDNFKFFFSI